MTGQEWLESLPPYQRMAWEIRMMDERLKMDLAWLREKREMGR